MAVPYINDDIPKGISKRIDNARNINKLNELRGEIEISEQLSWSPFSQEMIAKLTAGTLFPACATRCYWELNEHHDTGSTIIVLGPSHYRSVLVDDESISSCDIQWREIEDGFIYKSTSCFNGSEPRTYKWFGTDDDAESLEHFMGLSWTWSPEEDALLMAIHSVYSRTNQPPIS